MRFWTALTAATLAAVAALFAAMTALFTCSSTRRRLIAFSAVFLAACGFSSKENDKKKYLDQNSNMQNDIKSAQTTDVLKQISE
ncbi:hypothetical protein PanWU01x14_157330 [Parasponia andersonii]|uniref:Uncharacterized protein n=1 Tax=Parasponia andersonii TaxID=3476 RepID=A0A2P5CFP0_PARAD|nr:hypothetical protein PanWU01x14_157330 [Parasponia andersonii]